MAGLYVTMLVTSIGLFVYALTHIVNNIFDLIDMINLTNNSNSSEVFTCFVYLLNATGFATAIKSGVALLVSDFLGIALLKATMAGKNTVKSIIDILKVF